MTRFGEVLTLWQHLKVFGNFFKGFFSIWLLREKFIKVFGNFSKGLFSIWLLWEFFAIGLIFIAIRSDRRFSMKIAFAVMAIVLLIMPSDNHYNMHWLSSRVVKGNQCDQMDLLFFKIWTYKTMKNCAKTIKYCLK